MKLTKGTKPTGLPTQFKDTSYYHEKTDSYEVYETKSKPLQNYLKSHDFKEGLSSGIEIISLEREILTINQLNQKLKDKELSLLQLQDLIALQAVKLSSTRWENFKSLFTG